MVATRVEGGFAGRQWVKGLKYMVTEGNETSGGEHAPEYKCRFTVSVIN